MYSPFTVWPRKNLHGSEPGRPDWFSGLPSVLGGASDSLGARRLSGFTCYYYRGRVLQSILAGSTELHCRRAARKKVPGANDLFPLIVQNIHRYFLYLAIVFIFLLAYDVVESDESLKTVLASVSVPSSSL